MSMQMLALYGVAIVASALSLQGCGGGVQPDSPGGGGQPDSPTPLLRSSAPWPARPTTGPPSLTRYWYRNTTVPLNGIITLPPFSLGTLDYELTMQIVKAPALEKLYTEHRDAFTPDDAKLIDAVLDTAHQNGAGPAMSLMMRSLHAYPIEKEHQDFLLALEGSDSLTSTFKVKGQATVDSTGTRFSQTYQLCMSVFKIDFLAGDTLIKSITGVNTGNLSWCSRLGSHKDEERIASSMIV